MKYIFHVCFNGKFSQIFVSLKIVKSTSRRWLPATAIRIDTGSLYFETPDPFHLLSGGTDKWATDDKITVIHAYYSVR